MDLHSACCRLSQAVCIILDLFFIVRIFLSQTSKLGQLKHESSCFSWSPSLQQYVKLFKYSAKHTPKLEHVWSAASAEVSQDARMLRSLLELQLGRSMLKKKKAGGISISSYWFWHVKGGCFY